MARFSSVSTSDPLFNAASKAGLGLCFENEKNYSDAAKLYEEASEIEMRSEIAANYLFSAALNYELDNNSSYAKTLLEKLLKDYENYSKKLVVKQKLEKY